jgi:hypothetical protein
MRFRNHSKDVHDIYDDFARMFVYPNDIRYANILGAPASPPGIPGLVCPFHNRVHEWRIVDLEHLVETNLKPSHHAIRCAGWLEIILTYLPLGYYYGPEDI